MFAPLRSIREIRRALLARPGITARPTCEACGSETDPQEMRGTLCAGCKSERDQASEHFQQLNDATDWPSAPAPEFPMFGSDHAAKPFLPDDVDKPSPARRAYQRRSSRTHSPYTGRDERRADRRVVGVVKEDYWTRQQRLAEDAQAHEAAEEWDRNAEAEKNAMETGDVTEGPF